MKFINECNMVIIPCIHHNASLSTLFCFGFFAIVANPFIGADPIKYLIVNFGLNAGNWYMESEPRQNLAFHIGQFQRKVIFYPGIFFIGSGPKLIGFLNWLVTDDYDDPTVLNYWSQYWTGLKQEKVEFAKISLPLRTMRAQRSHSRFPFLGSRVRIIFPTEIFFW